jgi:poly(hydroxyalkanoate) depolymerase family esterase
MNPFFPFASAHDAFWSFFTPGPVNLAAQFFLDPQMDVAHSTVEERLQLKPQEFIDETLSLSCETSGAQVLVTEPLADPSVQETESPQWLDSRFEHQGLNYNFKIYVPSIYAGEPRPMIVMLHGAQQDPEDFAIGTGMNAAGEAHGYIVVYPEQSESANPLRCWNWFRAADRMLESGETAMVAALTREVMARYNIDTTRVYVAGMSAGGAMAVNLVVRHPDLFAAAAIHSGVAFGVADELLSALCAMNDGMGQVRLPRTLTKGDVERPRVVPLIVFHGDADDVVHPRNCDQISAMSRLLSGTQGDALPPDPLRLENEENGRNYTRQVFRDQKGLPIGEQWLVRGLGHAWSGGDGRGTHTDALGPHATREIVRFFRQFSLDL